ncbi:ABC transporter permease [Kribbella sp. NPDC026596]|uniref:ABC transporter permease n=1 Tax=Kribbella sp. NPDC026596 TaxID=3155122 RepID=UPI0033CE7D85
MSKTVAAPAPAPTAPDERVKQKSLIQRLMGRPEVGALAGAILIFVFFYIVAPPFRGAGALATVLYVSSTWGIPAVAVALLMIGGEFDLSAGVAVISSALFAAMFAFQLSTNVWVAVVLALVFSLAVGFANGWLVVRTGIPSFLVTLGTFFMLRGLNLGMTKVITGNVATDDVSNMDGFASARKVFASTVTVGGAELKVTLLWWLVFVLVATWILLRTRVGNWIFAVGGSADSSRAVGVPVKKVKIGLFMAVGFTAWFMGMHNLFAFNTVQSGNGVGNEFYYIIAAVVGGCLLTGGYGSAVGAAIGALIFGMSNQGITLAGWNPDWFYFFVGVLLLGAILLNTYIRRRAEASR